ncbi:MAG: PAS domain S-box protein [Chitinivibrionales bacterium]|nr:PAS domain S-box protein [Chitinivibrionales bacterium]
MRSPNPRKEPPSDLRKNAEKRLEQTRSEIKAMSFENVQDLVYDLQTHQIELEMQNEEIRRIENETARTRDRYVKLYNSAPIGYLTLSIDLTIKEANDTAARMLDVDKQKLVGSRLSPFVSTDEQDACYNCLRKAATTNEPQHRELSLLRHNGAMIHARLLAVSTQGPQGNGHELLVTLSDITEERRAALALQASENRYRFLWEQSQVVNVLLTLDGYIVDVNAFGLNSLGYVKEEVTGQPLINFVVHSQRDHLARRIEEIRKGSPTQQVDIQVYAKDGAVRTYMTSPGSQTLYSNRQPAGLLFSAADVTGRKNAEEKLQARTNELKETVKDLEAFAHSISHDLRNPLNNIEAMISVLNRYYFEKMDKDGTHCLKEITSSARRMAATIEDLLRLSRVNRNEPVFVRIELSELEGKIVEQLRKTRPRSSMQVDIQTNMFVIADIGLLRNALFNLIENAWKYTGGRQNPRIECGCINEADRNIYYVRDNGEGFDMKYAEKMFEPFRRITSNKQFEGSGIGLSLVKRIFNRLGGSVWARGEPGKGATFYFTLPQHS